MLNELNRVTAESLGRLSREAVRDRSVIQSLFLRLSRESIALRGGINRRNQSKTAQVLEVEGGRVRLRLENFDRSWAPQTYFNFEVDGERYFFAATSHGHIELEELSIELPTALFRAERRDLFRVDKRQDGQQAVRVQIRDASGRSVKGRILDWSVYGLGVEVEQGLTLDEAEPLRVVFEDGSAAGEVVPAYLRHATSLGLSSGSVKLGLSLSEVMRRTAIVVDRRDRILERNAARRIQNQVGFWRKAALAIPSRLARRATRGPRGHRPVPIVEYPNQNGEVIRAILDVAGDPKGAPAVVIPPAWGRRKETLLPLAQTILETFRSAGRSVVVARFDGTHRRGESHIDADVNQPGREYLHFTFSQAVRDIEATVGFLHETFEPSRTVLVTFSLASVEGRRALASDANHRIGGWVSVVGMVDLQSALRTISGGVDYAYGLQRGVRFGHHELVGVVADMDRTGLDAIRHNMVFLEEARRDMARIDVPISWIHGRYDAWMDLERIQDAMSCGDAKNRKLIEVPTGHQLRTSVQALETFQLVAEEVSEMATGSRLSGIMPDLGAVEERRLAEHARLPVRVHDLRAFWTNYLLGRDRRAGIELLTATAAYKNFMERQIELLQLEAGTRVADLGSGAGDFFLSLASHPRAPLGVHVDALDYVRRALDRGEERLGRLALGDRVTVQSIVADLDVQPGVRVPVQSDRYDAVLASLLISYVGKPALLLKEAFRIIRPGGTLVLSTLRRDADISKLFVEGMSELAPAAERELRSEVAQDFERLARSFFNDASRILDFEEDGTFRFWEDREVADLVSNAGFAHVSVSAGLGEPPQAVIVRAVKP